jgi:membrane-bound lytic murein transglycosylase D
MQLTKRDIFRCKNFPLFLFSAFLFLQGHTAFAQRNKADTSKKVLLASLSEGKPKEYLLRESNVVFPEILKGNEEEAMDYIEGFSNARKEYLVRMYRNGKVLLPKAAKILKKHDLPEELKVLLPLESAYNPKAISRAGAVGYWQIMDEVAREYGMRYATQGITTKYIRTKNRKGKTIKIKKKLVDDRMNFDKATLTAARYLHARRQNLNDDWLLVVASYNCGIGNVWAAMKKTGKDDPNFWEVKKYLPAETRAYVMNFIALNVIFSNYDNFIKDKLVFKPVKITLQNSQDENLPDDAFTSDY